MLNRMMLQVLRQLSEPTFTNPFPFPHMPEHLGYALRAAAEGVVDIVPPVSVPPRFRGRIAYDRSACIGCRLCQKVCPANAITFLPEEKKVIFHVDRCCFCEQCTEICPVNCIWMTDECLNSTYDRIGEIVRDSGPRNPATQATTSEAEDEQPRSPYEVDSDACIGCTKCAKVCPTQAISGKIKEKHRIDEVKCVGCAACADACPKNAIHPK
jgi:formate hydrogenlyase subunit 6/NADH:ubiquinone oxidoreductase subunit I